VCTIPAAQQEAPVKTRLSAEEEAAEHERGLANGLALLEPMKDKCLFIKPGSDYFTYAFW